MIWTFVAGATVLLLQQYHLFYRRLGPGGSPGLILLDGLVLLGGQLGLAVWLGIDLHWYALVFLLVFVFGPILLPFANRAGPQTLLPFRWPVGVAIVAATIALWLFSDHGLQLGRGDRSANGFVSEALEAEEAYNISPADIQFAAPSANSHILPESPTHTTDNLLSPPTPVIVNIVADQASNDDAGPDREELLDQMARGDRRWRNTSNLSDVLNER